MGKGTLIAIIVLVIIAAGAFLLYQHAAAPAPAVPGSSTSSVPTATTTSNAQQESFTWRFTDTAAPDATEPSTGVTLVLGTTGKSYDLGKYVGSCSAIDGSSWKLVEGELSGVICWWAGGGTELGVFRDGSNFVVKTGLLDEGTAETPGMRGSFKTLLTLN